jgi:hypothetical protein
MKRYAIAFAAVLATVAAAVFSANETLWNLRNTDNSADVFVIDAEGDVTATSFTGSGSGLTGVPATALSIIKQTNTVVSAVAYTYGTNTFEYLNASTNLATNSIVYVATVTVTSGSVTNVKTLN